MEPNPLSTSPLSGHLSRVPGRPRLAFGTHPVSAFDTPDAGEFVNRPYDPPPTEWPIVGITAVHLLVAFDAERNAEA